MDPVIAIGLIAAKVAFLIAMLLLLPLPLVWLERKIAGHMQQRLGPMRVGWHGLLQPVADGIKLLTKEDHIPAEADRFLFKLAPLLAMVPPFVVFVAIPFGESFSVLGTEITLYVSDMNVALLFILGVIGIEVYGVIFGGWAANSKYAVLGSLRTCAQMISYEIPMGFSIIGVVMLAQSMSLLDIVRAQADVWFVVYQPIGFFVFFVAGLAEAQRIPFDLAEAEGDLGAGFHTEYSGIRFAFFMVSEYADHGAGLGAGGDPVLRRMERGPAPPAAADLVHPQGGVLHLRVHVVPLHLPPLPLRPADGDRVEGAAAAVDREHLGHGGVFLVR